MIGRPAAAVSQRCLGPGKGFYCERNNSPSSLPVPATLRAIPSHVKLGREDLALLHQGRIDLKMEVLGILSAIPALVELVSGTTKLVWACASKTSLAKATKGLDVQLNLLGEVLAGIDERWKAKTLSSDQLTWLGPVVKELREELASLNSLLAKSKYTKPRVGLRRQGKARVVRFRDASQDTSGESRTSRRF